MTNELSNLLRYGSPTVIKPPLSLRAGKLCLLYERGFIRYIRIGDLELIRMINYAVRDQDWGTVEMEILNEKIDEQPDSFSIQYEAYCRSTEIVFHWVCKIEGNSNSTLVFSISGEALTTFKRNRIGFCVMHPIKPCQSKECQVTHADGLTTKSSFPSLVNAHQIFSSVKSMRWRPRKGIEALLQFDGETFETEDQRNWTDASYKTYCTPLSNPFPVLVQSGESLMQRILVSTYGDHDLPEQSDEVIRFSVEGDEQYRFPLIGTSLNLLPIDSEQVKVLKELGLDYIRLELHGHAPDLDLRIQNGIAVSKALEIPLELVLFFESDADQLLLPITSLRESVIQIIVLSLNSKVTPPELLDEVVPRLRDLFPTARIGAGTDAFFAELNRERPDPGQIDYLSFSVNPQVHASDLSSLTETLQAQEDVVRSARAFSCGKAIHVGPVTFKMRWNPNAAQASKKIDDQIRFDNSCDSRQASQFGSAWTLGSFKYLTEGGVSAITFFESSGWRGLIPNVQHPWPIDLGFPEMSVYPVYEFLKVLLKLKNGKVSKFVSSHPLLVNGIMISRIDGNRAILLANYTPTSQWVNLDNLQVGDSWSIEILSVSASVSDHRASVSWQERAPRPNGQNLVIDPFAVLKLEENKARTTA